jgi:hypothetical protein
VNESRHRTWDIRIKVVGLVALLASGWWTIYKFRDDRRIDLQHQEDARKHDELARRSELNSYIFQRQANVYLDAVKAAATIATSSDHKAQQEARERYDELYDGEIKVLADNRVFAAMSAFKVCIDHVDSHGQCRSLSSMGLTSALAAKALGPNVSKLDAEAEVAKIIPARQSPQPELPLKHKGHTENVAGVTLGQLTGELAACIRMSLETERSINFGTLHSAGDSCPYSDDTLVNGQIN